MPKQTTLRVYVVCRILRRAYGAIQMATCTSSSRCTAPVVCLGCGEVSRRSSDRRNLASTVSQHVASLWKSIMESELQNRNQVVDLDSLISGRGEPRKGGQMCRKCFYAYEKALNARAIVEANAVKALDAIAPVISSLAREMQPCTSSSTSCKPGITTSAGKERRRTPMFSPDVDVTQGRKRSPDVAVRMFNS